MKEPCSQASFKILACCRTPHSEECGGFSLRPGAPVHSQPECCLRKLLQAGVAESGHPGAPAVQGAGSHGRALPGPHTVQPPRCLQPALMPVGSAAMLTRAGFRTVYQIRCITCWGLCVCDWHPSALLRRKGLGCSACRDLLPDVPSAAGSPTLKRQTGQPPLKA